MADHHRKAMTAYVMDCIRFSFPQTEITIFHDHVDVQNRYDCIVGSWHISALVKQHEGYPRHGQFEVVSWRVRYEIPRSGSATLLVSSRSFEGPCLSTCLSTARQALRYQLMLLLKDLST